MSSYGPAVLRFAPSPNGWLHLGHAYSALRNEAVARETGGRLLLRIEDLDRTRCKRAFEEAIVADVAWLGLRFDGPPRRQSEHERDYAAALDRLEGMGLLYPCFCSRGEVARAAIGRDPDGAPLYAGTCRGLPDETVAARIAHGGRFALRLDMQRAIERMKGALFWTEYGEGDAAAEQRAEPAKWGDVVLRGRDLAASYHLAVTLDDATQGVTDIVRGRDLFAATSVHRLLQELFGLPAPRYRHHRLVLDPEGAKLAKSRLSRPLRALRAEGIAPAQIRASLGFGAGDAGGFAVRLS